LGKTNPLNDNDLKEFVRLQKGFDQGEDGETEKSWSLNVADIDQSTYDLSVKNPNAEEDAPLREPKAIIEEIIALDKESEAILAKIQELV
jgi:type I restriction enzyme M protein